MRLRSSNRSPLPRQAQILRSDLGGGLLTPWLLVLMRARRSISLPWKPIPATHSMGTLR